MRRSIPELMARCDAMIHAPLAARPVRTAPQAIQKAGDPPMTAKEEIEHRMKELVVSGKAEHAGHALDLIMQERPELWTRYMREPPTVAKAAPAPVPPVQVTHPQGVKKDRDGVPLAWEAQVQHWRDNPGAYERYRRHFAPPPPRPRG